MNYAETTNWMFNKFPMYQKIGASAYKPDLGNIKELLDFLLRRVFVPSMITVKLQQRFVFEE